MTQSNLIQDLITKLDLYLPWLLPALETVEHTAPSAVRLALCAVLMVWFAVVRRDSAVSSSSVHHLV